MSMTIQHPDATGSLDWIISLLRLAERAAEGDQVNAARTARELAERLRSVESIYESDETARDLVSKLAALRNAVDPISPMTRDPEMVEDFVHVTSAELRRLEALLKEQQGPAVAADIIASFRKVEGLAASLQLSALAEVLKSAAESAGQPPAGHDLTNIRRTLDEIRSALSEIHADADGE